MSWDKYFMDVAVAVSRNSKCLSRQVGAVLVRDKSIISVGYNGPPRGVPHCETRNPNAEKICPRQLAGYKSGEKLEWCIAGHAERNAIVNAARMGVCIKGSTLYCNCGVPCKDCLVEIINAGVVEIVCNDPLAYYDEMSEYLVKNSCLSVRKGAS